MKYLSALLALVLLPLAALAQGVTPLPPMSVITFTPGSNTATMNGQMMPGGRDLYYVQAKAGQTMNVSVASAAPVAFQVYHPDATVARAADGSPLITGKTLPDAGPNDKKVIAAWLQLIHNRNRRTSPAGADMALGDVRPARSSTSVK